MKNKILATMLFLLLVLTSLNVVVGSDTKEENFETLTISESIVFSNANLETEGDFLKISVDNTEKYTMEAGRQMLPVITKTYTFPRETRINEVEITCLGEKEEIIDGKIQIAPEAIPVNLLKVEKQDSESADSDLNVYSISEAYPEKNYDYTITSGINGLTLTVHIYPYIYISSENKLVSFDEVNIDIVYEKSNIIQTFVEEYDMVIIAPRLFSSELKPLVDHKNDVNVRTFLKTTEDIYDEYPGRDNAEQVKYFIKDAIETYNVKFVLLVGGMKGIRKQWYVPVRYTNVDVYWESGTLSDLYFSDIYRFNESSQSIEFDDWDSNGNGVFAEWFSSYPEDLIDCSPDVALGRFACRSQKEVRTIVRKTINYETKAHDSTWAKKMLVGAGDTFPGGEGNIYYEGEMTTTASSNLMQSIGYNIEKLYVSDGTFTGTRDFLRALRKGAEIVHVEGHGNPAEWVTHPINDESWIYGLTVFNMQKIRNNDPLPIVVIGACHSSQFNVTPLNFFEGILPRNIRAYFDTDPSHPGGFWRYEYIGECWSWKLLSLRNGGAVATIGNSGLGYGYPGSYALEGVGQWLAVQLFDAIAIQGMGTIGEAHAQSIVDYVNEFDYHNSDRSDRKTIDGWTLLGDPSLRIGGYEEIIT